MSWIVDRESVIPSDPQHLFQLVIRFKLKDYQNRAVEMTVKEFETIARMTPGRLKNLLHEYIRHPDESMYQFWYNEMSNLPQFVDIRRPKAKVVGIRHG